MTTPWYQNPQIMAPMQNKTWTKRWNNYSGHSLCYILYWECTKPLKNALAVKTDVTQCFMYAIILRCLLLFPSLLSLLSFNNYFVVLYKKLPSQLNTMRQDKICYNSRTFSMLKREKPKPHHDPLHCDMKTQDQVLTEWHLNFNTNTEIQLQTQQKILTTSTCT
jgi:hypothetical protein